MHKYVNYNEFFLAVKSNNKVPNEVSMCKRIALLQQGQYLQSQLAEE